MKEIMKAIRVYLDTVDTEYVGLCVESLNEFDEIVATMVNGQELFVAGVGECAIAYAKVMLTKWFACEVTFKEVK